MSDLPKRLPGATLAWPIDDPDATVFGPYFGDSQDGAGSAFALLHRVLDGLHHLATEPGSNPATSRLDPVASPPGPPRDVPENASRKQGLVVTDESDVDQKVAALTAAVRALLRREREQRGWTLEVLAARIDGISAQRLEALENGAVETRVTDLWQICWALGLDPAAVVREASGGTGGS